MPIASNRPSPRRAALAALLATATLALAACAGLQPKTPEDVVRERSEARWDALIKRDFDKAWEYTQPAYRALVGQKDYYKRFGGAGQWKGVQIHEVTCEPERCTVRLRVAAKVQAPPFTGQELVTYLEEVWVRDEGQWWYFQAF